MKLHDCLLVIGELTMAKRYLEDEIETLKAELATLKEEGAEDADENTP